MSPFKKNYEIMAIGPIEMLTGMDKKTDERLVRHSAAIEKIWQETQKEKNGQLFNGTLPHFIRFNKQADKINIVAHFVEYKTFLAEQKQPDLKLGITPIGVSGIIVLKEATNQYVFFARRAPHVTEYPGFLELVPSGSLDEGCVDASGIVYYQSQLLREFVEETGLPQEYVKDISGFALVLDTNHHVYDICCEISLEAKKEFILKEFSSDEYNDPAFVAMNDLDHFIKSNCDSIVPTSLALIEAYLQIAL